MSWQTFALRDVVESAQSGFASGEKNVTAGFKHIRMNNIHVDGRLDLSLVRTVPQELATMKYQLQKDDVLVCTTNSGKLVGKSAMFNIVGDFAFSNHLTRLRIRRDIAEPAFVQKQLWFKWMHGEIEPLCKHWVNQSTLPKEELLGLVVSLPDIEQQRRIVTKLNKITTHIDDAKERLNTIPITLKRFRQSILAAACSGRLTADWRVKNQSVEWSEATLGSIFQMRNGKSLTMKNRVLGDVPVFGGNGLMGTHYASNVKGQLIIVGRVGAQCGNVHYTSGEAWVTDNAISLQAKINLLPEFYAFFLRSMNLNELSGGTGQPYVSQEILSPVLTPIVSLEEQAEIVRRVEALFKQADAIEARYKKANAFVEKLTPSVLAKAFRGELG